MGENAHSHGGGGGAGRWVFWGFVAVAAAFGDEYLRYARRTPAYFPRLSELFPARR